MPNITFVTYHTDLSEEAVQVLLEKNPIFKDLHWEKYLPLSRQCVNLMFESLKLVYDDCRYVLISDFSTHFEEIEGVELIRYDVDPDKPAYMRLTAQIEFLKNNPATHVVFLDYDMLVQHDLSPLFEKDFDIGFSYRLMYNGIYCPCPINGGLILAHQKHIDTAAAFLESVKDTYDKNYPNNKEWGGFQGAVADVVGDENIFYKKSDIITINDSRILLLPVEEYNYTIAKKDQIVEYMPDKKILHFKGPEKMI